MKKAPSNHNNEPSDAFGSQLKQQQQRKFPWFKSFGLAVLLIAVSLGAYFTLTQHGKDTFDIIKDVPKVLEVQSNPDLIFDNANSNIVNILLIGRDVNYKIIFKNGQPIAHTYDEDTPARSDTMILISLDKTKRTLRMISFPRDALVQMPPNKYDVDIAKLNAAHAYGGPAMLMQTLHDDLGVTVHHYAVIRFEGFKTLIDKVGGVNVDVIGALHRDGSRGPLNYDDDWGNLHIHLEPGMQHLNGTEAHNYVRFRMDIEGDPGRIRRQQQVLRALAKSLSHQPIYKIPGLVQEIRKQFKTDMSVQEIASAAFFAKSLGHVAAEIQPVTLFGVYSERGSIILNKSKNIQLLSFLLGSTFNSSVFLDNSPSTERDELGRENDSSPGAQALLRAAGLLDDSPARDNSDNDRSETTSEANASTSAPSRLAESVRTVRNHENTPEPEPEPKPQPQKSEPSSSTIHQLSVADTTEHETESTTSDSSMVPVRNLSNAPREIEQSSPVPRSE